MQRDEMYRVEGLSGDRQRLVFAKRVEVPLTAERRARLTHDLQATHVACAARACAKRSSTVTGHRRWLTQDKNGQSGETPGEFDCPTPALSLRYVVV